jgi:hypothetical protein
VIPIPNSKAACQGGQNGKQSVNTLSCNAENATRQAAVQDPLRAAQLHNFALRLDLRRVRRNLVGAQHVVVVNRLLDATAAFGRALEWMRARPNATEDNLPEMGLVPMDVQPMPDAIDAVTQ